jgi:hypothetical protein
MVPSYLGLIRLDPPFEFTLRMSDCSRCTLLFHQLSSNIFHEYLTFPAHPLALNHLTTLGVQAAVNPALKGKSNVLWIVYAIAISAFSFRLLLNLRSTFHILRLKLCSFFFAMTP